MKRFHFQLERVLDYKNQILDSLVGEEAAIMARIREQERVIAGLEQEYITHCKTMNESQKNGTDAMSIRIYENYLDTLGVRIQNARKELLLLKQEEEVKRKQLLEAKKDSTSLVKLKERKYSEYQSTYLKQTEKEIEEFISNNRRTLIRT